LKNLVKENKKENMKALNEKHQSLIERVERCYKVIKECNEELEHIRKNECEHPRTRKVNYMWAPGHTMPDTEMCSVCGEVIKVERPKVEMTWSSNAKELLKDGEVARISPGKPIEIIQGNNEIEDNPR
jgi:hypothetical protein